MSVRPAKTQISLGIHPIWSESSLCAQWVAKDPSFLHADSEDSDQTGQMPRLIWVFAGRTAILLVLSCHGSNTLLICSTESVRQVILRGKYWKQVNSLYLWIFWMVMIKFLCTRNKCRLLYFVIMPCEHCRKTTKAQIRAAQIWAILLAPLLLLLFAVLIISEVAICEIPTLLLHVASVPDPFSLSLTWSLTNF